MAVMLELTRIEAVLITGEWIEVHDKSFKIITIKFTTNGTVIYDSQDMGYAFQTDNQIIAGPLSAIQGYQFSR